MMFKMLLRIFALTAACVCMFIAPTVVHAQQEQGPSTLLPDIDPQDIEIVGDYQVRFPGLFRQPILGFSPRPPIFRLDPDRMPFLETDEEIVAAIPLSDLQPAFRPEKDFIVFNPRSRVFGRSGLGTFTSPELGVLVEHSVRPGESMLADVSHFSTAGDREHGMFRDTGARFQWVRQSGEHRFGIGMHAAASGNYSATPAGVDTSQVVVPRYMQHGVPADNVPRMLSTTSFGLQARWQQLQSAYRGWQSTFELDRFSKEGELLTETRAQTSETNYQFTLHRFFEGSRIEQLYSLTLASTGGFYETGLDDSSYWLTNSLSVRYRQLFRYQHEVQAWLRLHQLYDPVNEFDVYLYPDIHYRYNTTGRVTAAVRVRGFVRDPSLQSIHQNNRLTLQAGQHLEHERGLNIQLHAGGRPLPRTKIFSGLDYWQYYNLGIFGRSRGVESPFYSFYYVGEAIRVKWYSGLTHDMPRINTTIMFDLGLNYSTIDSDILPSGVIPYLPDWQTSLQVVTRPVRMLETSFWMDLTGTRNTDLEDESVPGYAQLGVKADLRVHRHVGVYIKAQNLLNQDYEVWQDYVERPLQVFGGVTLHW